MLVRVQVDKESTKEQGDQRQDFFQVIHNEIKKKIRGVNWRKRVKTGIAIAILLLYLSCIIATVHTTASYVNVMEEVSNLLMADLLFSEFISIYYFLAFASCSTISSVSEAKLLFHPIFYFRRFLEYYS